MKGTDNSKDEVATPRNPVVLKAIFRNSAGPMKASKRWLHKRTRMEGKRLIKMGLQELSG